MNIPTNRSLSSRLSRESTIINWVLVAGASLVVSSLFITFGLLFVLFVLTVLTGYVLLTYTWRLVARRDGPALYLCALPLATMWLLFGLGGIMAIGLPTDLRISWYAVAYDDWAPVLMAFVVSLSAVAYYLCFEAMYRKRMNIGSARETKLMSLTIIEITIVLLLLFDVYMRYKSITAGVYFRSVAKYFLDPEVSSLRSGLLARLNWMAWPIIIAFSVARLRLGGPWPRWIYKIIIAFELVATFMSGTRKLILIGFIVFAVSWFITGGFKERTKVVRMALLASVLIVIFFGVVSPIIQEARYKLRDERETLAAVSQVPGLFLTHYIPDVLRAGSLFSQESIRIQNNATFLHRISSYTIYVSSINQRVRDGVPLMSDNSLFLTISGLMPSVLATTSKRERASQPVANHFSLGRENADVAGTPMGSIYAYLGIIGVVLLMSLAGGGYGFVASVLPHRLGLIGALATSAFALHALPLGDSFVFYIANLRNAIIIAVVVLVTRPRI